ncbi:MAG: hypothetical protein LBG60_08300 [Bifidobacteriaceae bacterium]|nr:hypothetical protein [Bifidobacteriaceae bacterium]
MIANQSRCLGSGKSGGTAAERFKELDDLFEGGASSLKAKHGIGDAQILAWAKHGMDPAQMKNVLDGAAGISTAARRFDAEKAAEQWWRGRLARPLKQRLDKIPAGGGSRSHWIYDVIGNAKDGAGGSGVAFELRIGRVRNATKRAAAQVEADRALMRELAANPGNAIDARGFRRR